jgi:hypothetical protein
MPKRSVARIDYSQMNGTQEELSSPLDLEQETRIEDFADSQDVIQQATPSKKTRYTNSGKMSSWVWKHFSETPSGSYYGQEGQMKPDTIIRCNHLPCKWSILDSKRKFSTSNMKRHLGHRHNVFENSPDTSPMTNASAKSKEQLEEDIVWLFVTEDLSFTLIECPYFRKLLSNVPTLTSSHGQSAITLVSRIESSFDPIRNHLQDLLDKTCVSIALSLDIWSSSNNISYLGVIGHCIGQNFKYYERLLDFVLLSGPHTAENLSNTIFEALSGLGLSSKFI